jgi:hypothetical protein
MLAVLLLASLAVCIQGYHPGVEDDGVYLAAIHSDLDANLYPHDAQLFRVQMQASIFDKLVAASIRLTHLPVNFAALLWQLAAISLVLAAMLGLARRMFASPPAQWSAVVMVAALFALPVAGTALFLIDPQLHPRTIATGLILLAASAILDRKFVLAILLLLAAGVMHPIMAAFGFSFCFFLWLTPALPVATSVPALFAVPVAGTPAPHALAWLFDKPTPSWRLAMSTRRYIFLSQWQWYEWLGVFAPLVLLYVCYRWAANQAGDLADPNSGQTSSVLARVSRAVVFYGAFQFAIALLISVVPELVRLLPLQPMRFLHLVYIFLALIAGGLAGQFVLQRKPLRWAALYLPLGAAMAFTQYVAYPATPHLELPGISDGARSRNPWVEAFVWTRANTPSDAYFALDPNYMQLPGEDYHSFRALAQRSVLADAVKDSAVAMQVPRLAPLWQQQVTAIQNFQNFQPADFARLRQDFGVTWTIVPAAKALPFNCPYQNEEVKVCQLPGN